MTFRLRARNPIACVGHGICAELFPEWIRLDDWGYPIIDARDIPPGAARPTPAAPRPPARSWHSRSTVDASDGLCYAHSSADPTPAGDQTESEPSVATGHPAGRGAVPPGHVRAGPRAVGTLYPVQAPGAVQTVLSDGPRRKGTAMSARVVILGGGTGGTLRATGTGAPKAARTARQPASRARPPKQGPMALARGRRLPHDHAMRSRSGVHRRAGRHWVMWVGALAVVGLACCPGAEGRQRARHRRASC